jgi:hypothetical protein
LATAHHRAIPNAARVELEHNFPFEKDLRHVRHSRAAVTLGQKTPFSGGEPQDRASIGNVLVVVKNGSVSQQVNKRR